MKKWFCLFLALVLAFVFAACGEQAPAEGEGIDYLVLVNKTHPLPEDWEDNLSTVHITNSLGDDVEVEAAAYDSYLQLKDALEQEGVYVDLDSARRSIAAQQQIVDDFTAKYGPAYVAKYVAVPGYSEHHTGLALDLYLIIDGVDVYENEDMVQYSEIWAQIHEKLADYGFILRYLEGKEHITGYGYEPWHIRYVGSADIAKEITDKGITLEGYLGAAIESEPMIDLGSSGLYTEEQMEDAVFEIKREFATWDGCELHSIRYAGDECNSEENVQWMNDLDGEQKYEHCIEFLADFHSPVEGGGAWEPDKEYTDYQFWLGQTDDGWDLLTFGY